MRLRISRRGFNKLFKSHRVKKAISNGTLRTLEKYSQKVDKDVTTELLTERRFLPSTPVKAWKSTERI